MTRNPYFLLAVAAISMPLILPLILRAVLGVKQPTRRALGWRERVELRYQRLGTSVWLFARFKLRLDPMFRELPRLIEPLKTARTVLDIGCGHGFTGSALLEWLDGVKIYGIDPSPARVRNAAAAFAQRGEVVRGAAPDIPTSHLPDVVDAVLMLDVVHYLPEDALVLTLTRLRSRLAVGGHLFIRAIIAPSGRGSLLWHIEAMKRSLHGVHGSFRPPERIKDTINAAGFDVVHSQLSGNDPEMVWFIATASPPRG